MAVSVSRKARVGWLPAALLVFGLAAIARIVSGSTAASNVQRFRPDWGTYQIQHYPSGWWSLPDSPVDMANLGGGVTVTTLAFTIVYLAGATAMGVFLVDGLRGDDRWPWPVSALASFLPGYLMLLVPLQLLFAVVPLQAAVWIALVGLPAIAVVLHRRALVRTGRALRYDPATRRRIAVATVVVVVAVVVAAVHRLQAGRFFLMQDSLLWWLVGADWQTYGSLGKHLGQWNQQSDEWIFGAPLLFRSYTEREACFSFYVTQSLGLVSFACLVFGIVHRLAQRRRVLAGCLAVGVVLASTPVIYPWRYATIIGGDNPILWTGQVGRQIGVVAPWAALLLIGRQRRPMVIAIGLATAGLAFTSLQSVGYVVLAVSVALIWRGLGDRGRSWMERRPLRGLAYLLPVATIAMFALAAWWLHQAARDPTDAVWWLLASTAVAVSGAVAIGLATSDRTTIGLPRAHLVWIGAWAVAVAGGFLLSNNSVDALVGDGPRQVLSTVLPGYGGPLLARQDLGGDLLGNLSFPSFSPIGCTFFIFCVSFDGFLLSLGFVLLVVLATWLALGRMTSEAQTNARRVALLLMLAALTASVVVMLFTGAQPPGAQPVIFSRLLDVPYYGLLALAAMTFASSKSRATVIAGTGVLTIWSIVPLISSQWPEQMVRNAGWILHHPALFQ